LTRTGSVNIFPELGSAAVGEDGAELADAVVWRDDDGPPAMATANNAEQAMA
jgi:hypothetical protein